MLTVNNLKKTYQSALNKYPVLKDVSFQVEDGEFTAVMGASGSGKSTLLNCISCYIPFDSGTIVLGDCEISKLSEDDLASVRNEKLGFVFQDFLLLDGLTVRENILIPKIINDHVDSLAEKLTDQLLSIFGLFEIKDKYPAEISGGERQRTAVARSLINNPLLILADEPTGNLDSKSSQAVISSFLDAKKEMNATTLMVTHDSFAASFCDKVILLKDGTVYKEIRSTGNQSSFQDLLLTSIKEMSVDK